MPDHTDTGSEFDIIRRHFRPLAADDAGALSLTDDAAVFDVPSGRQLVVTTDALVAGVHFLTDLSPEDIAHKVIGVNLSDLAAMGAVPRAVFLAAQFPKDTEEGWIARFAHGLADVLAGTGATLLGGDTVSTPGPLAFTVTAIGHVGAGRALTRAGAQDGDDLYVTGTIGDGALGLLCATGARPRDDALIERYARPRPRNAFAVQLAERGLATACVDISDGLAADVAHICEASGLGAQFAADRVPVSAAARDALAGDPALLRTVLTGGDDYELAFAAAPQNAAEIEALARELDLNVTNIGRFEANEAGGAGVRVLDGDGRLLDLGAGGYRHL